MLPQRSAVVRDRDFAEKPASQKTIQSVRPRFSRYYSALGMETARRFNRPRERVVWSRRLPKRVRRQTQRDWLSDCVPHYCAI